MYIKKSVYKSYPEIHEEIIQGKFLPKYFESHIYTYKVIDGTVSAKDSNFEYYIHHSEIRQGFKNITATNLSPSTFFFKSDPATQ